MISGIRCMYPNSLKGDDDLGSILQESVDIVRNKVGEKLKDITVENVVMGIFFSGVKLSTGQGGMCFTPVKMIPEAVCCPSSAKLMPSPGKLKGRSADEYLDDIFANSILKKTLGIATLNALSVYCYENGLLPDIKVEEGIDAFDIPDLSKHRKAVVVGALVPILKRLTKEGVDYTVLEKDVRTLKGEELKHFADAEKYPEVVPEADILFITGTTLINDTLEGLLEVAKPGAEIIVAGPTVSMIAEPFRKRGVTILGGDYVHDADKALEILSEAGSGYHLFGKSTARTVIKL